MRGHVKDKKDGQGRRCEDRTEWGRRERSGGEREGTFHENLMKISIEALGKIEIK